MNFTQLMEKIAKDLGGQFSEYDQDKSILVVPLKDGRYQTVVAVKRHVEQFKRDAIEFTSKVCEATQDIDCTQLLKQNALFIHAKFAIAEGFLRVEAASYIDQHATESFITEIIKEVAESADEWELKLTGMDVH